MDEPITNLEKRIEYFKNLEELSITQQRWIYHLQKHLDSGHTECRCFVATRPKEIQ